MSFVIFTDAPMLDLVLGAKLNPEDIEEGDDVYFKCRIRANPPAYKVTWKHDVSISKYAPQKYPSHTKVTEWHR